MSHDTAWSAIDAATVERLRNLRSGGQSDLYQRLIELFDSGSARALLELRAALDAGQLPQAAAICHRLASSAANVGALAFAHQVRELERSCKANDSGGAQGLYQRLCAVHPQLLGALQHYRLQANA